MTTSVSLVRANKAQPSTSTAFPIFRVDNGKTQKKIKTLTEGMRSDPITRIKDLQPYNAVDPDTDPLAILYDLSIEDKHRLPVISVFSIERRRGLVGGIVVVIERMVKHSGVIGALDDCAPVLTYTIRGRDVQVEEQYAFQVAFEKAGPGKGEPFRELLSKLIEFVEGVIDDFARFV